MAVAKLAITNTPKNMHLKLLSINVRGIKSKLKSLESTLQATGTHIAGISETHLQPKEIIHIEGYVWIHKARDSCGGGGVGFLIRNDIFPAIQSIKNKEDTGLKIMWIKINTKPTLHIAIYYGPQENVKAEQLKDEYKQLENSIREQKSTNIIVMGDFNAKIEINKVDIKQVISRNGKQLTKLLEKNQMVATTMLNKHIGTWTRINSKKQTEKSIIDYFIISNNLQDSVEESSTDDSNSYMIKGTAPSDHKVITLTIATSKIKTANIIKKWKTGSEADWERYNTSIQTLWNSRIRIKDQYNQLHQIIMKSLRINIGKSKIDTNKRYKINNKQITTAKEKRKQLKTAYKDIIKHATNKEEIKAALNIFVCQQKIVRSLVSDEECKRTEGRIDALIQTGGEKSNLFWKIRKKLLKIKEEAYDTITEEGVKLTDGDQSKVYIANYFEDLYQAREGERNQQTWSEEIENKVHSLNTTSPDKIQEITKDELTAAIKSLKRKKSAGPDDIPNEALIETDTITREIMRGVFNEIYRSCIIPDQWRNGIITRIYKGKGQKGKLSNERGITLSSNIGKLFERIINKRIQQDINITSNQGGGMKGKSTSDHLLRIMNFIRKSKKQHKTTYVVFLDVTKAYDKAWGKAILYSMNKSGIEGQNWKIAKELNEKITAKVKTKHGQTRSIQIKDSIRQGGILSVVEYANMMDEITKEIEKDPQNKIKCGLETTVGCLLWMDDVALMHNNPVQLQNMLNTTNQIASKYRIKFGAEKSKFMIIKGDKTPATSTQIEEPPKKDFKLGEMLLEEASTYKYLGVLLNNKGTLTNHIEAIKGKAEASLQTIINIAANKELVPVQMPTIWKLYRACTIPIMTYAAESWIPYVPELKELQKKHSSMLKRILKVPTSTPDAAIFIETGMPTIHQLIDEQQLTYLRKMKLYKSTEHTSNTPWGKNLTARMKENNTTIEEITKMSKIHLKGKIKDCHTKKIIQQAEVQSKSKDLNKTEYQENGMPKYMNVLSRNHASAVFKLRSRMLNIKGNYPSNHTSKECRWCDDPNETQSHILTKCKRFQQLTKDLLIEKAMKNNKDGLYNEAIIIEKIEAILNEKKQS